MKMRTCRNGANCAQIAISVLSFTHMVVGLANSAVRSATPSFSSQLLGRNEGNSPTPAHLRRWMDGALDFSRRIDCDSVSFTTTNECRRLQTRISTEMNIYVASSMASSNQRYTTVLPDGGLSRSGEHDAVLALDPYPQANFGHLVLVFFVNLNMNWVDCRANRGSFLGNGECLQLAEKQRCRNRLRPRSGQRLCDINFLPLVYFKEDESRQQQLHCYDSDQFAACPDHPSDTGNYTVDCVLTNNTPRCEVPRPNVRFRCKFYEICDQAVLISGGWNHNTSFNRHTENIRSMHNMLRVHGFRRPNIKTFFADNRDVLEDDNDGGTKHTYSATNKNVIRNHISDLCSNIQCSKSVDTLFIYMNSPSMTDGTSLLWDANRDGLAETSETYSPAELLADLEGCTANRVYIVADQSFSGSLVTAFQSAQPSTNIALFASGSNEEYSWSNEFTQRWVNANHTTECVSDIHQDYVNHLTSSPQLLETRPLSANTTIFGAPCDRLQLMEQRELKVLYMGCQNLPATSWLTSKIRRANRG